MRVFVTGSTGFVGSSVVKEFLSTGHSVVGLTRSEKGVEQLKALGAEAVNGTIEDVALLEATAATVDAAVHLAFVHEFSKFAEACATDRAAITALGNGLVKAGGGAQRSLVVTSGTMLLASSKRGEVLTEASPFQTASPLAAARGPSEKVCLDFAKKENGGLRASVVRLPPVTHGPGGVSGFAGHLASVAIKTGKSVYVGDGQNRWSAGHRDDAAQLYRLAAEKAEPGSVFHASVEQGVLVKDIATAIGKQLGLPIESLEGDAVDAHFNWFAIPCRSDNVVSSQVTQETLGWKPTHVTLMEDLPAIVEFAKTAAAAETK
ncbi:oxidoreductase [Sporothrix brasiliensis 5110]|uniref:Oxidoreductase n=1 Tax=Sporothrix brasiliensis 5110 TaxID=1398154 RepID=A0A0C2IVS9_9PEZI|nr:oxidoreductase [Sporothrix brasiliensis 5110]KIH93236.1 oxidoreductase [Sporothrix brasiliensis 5110]